MAVGEMSPENENSTSSMLRGGGGGPGGRTSATSPRIRKQDSYLKAIGNNEDELSPLPRRLVQVRYFQKGVFTNYVSKLKKRGKFHRKDYLQGRNILS